MIPSLPVRAFQTLFSPGQMFEKLKEEPAWFGMLLLAGIATGASAMAIPVDVYAEAIRAQWAQQGVSPPMSPEQAAGFARYAGAGGALVFAFIWAFLLAGLALVAFNFILGSELSYKKYLCIAAHGSWISGLGALAVTPLRILAEDAQLRLSVASFAWFLEGGGYLFRFLNLLDLFALWGALVMAVGVSVMDRRRSWGGAATVFVGIWIVVALVFAIFPGAA